MIKVIIVWFSGATSARHASHSGIRAVGNVSRDMVEELLLALKQNGGVIQVVGFASDIKPESPDRTSGSKEENIFYPIVSTLYVEKIAPLLGP